MQIELILGEDLYNVAKTNDIVRLKDDNTFEIVKVDGTIIQKPFGGFADWNSCIQQNKDKDSPEKYCGKIKHLTEDTKKEDIEKVEDTRSTEEKPTKEWWNSCVKRVKEGNPDYTDEQVNATCGKMHYSSTGMGTKKEYDPRIEKYLSISKERAWDILNKIYKSGHLDTYSILKEVLNKVATCPNVTDKFEKIMEGWMQDGEADTASIEKIINACKSEGGNIDKSDKIIEALRR